jgi:hypothetical protein
VAKWWIPDDVIFVDDLPHTATGKLSKLQLRERPTCAGLSISREPELTTPITLCGFAVSNYYNKVKLSLLEKGVPFSEAVVYPSQSEEMLSESPMGKVPFLRTPKGVLSESQVLTEFIEDNWPEPPLYPQRPCARPLPRADRTCRVAPRAASAPPVQGSLLRRHGVR